MRDEFQALDGTPCHVELTPPDLSAYAEGNTGIPYAWRFESERPGPHALIVGLTHGNELCGAVALDRLLRSEFRPARGTLTLCFANVEAYQRFDPSMPEASRFVQEDLNRVWDAALLDRPPASLERARARRIRPLVDAADVLLDLHSMQQKSAPLALAGTRARGIELARRIGLPELIVIDPGHAAGPRLRDYGPFGSVDGDKAAVLVECGQHWLEATADVAVSVTARFLAALDMMPMGVAAEPPPQRVIEVTHVITVSGDRFEFTEPYQGLEVIAEAGTLIGRDGGSEIRTPYDECVLIMPSRRLVRGQTAVQLGRFQPLPG